LIEVANDLVGLLVGNHALVGALHLVQEHDINVCLCALAEASRQHQTVEEVLVVADVLELLGGCRTHKGAPETRIARGSTHFKIINYIQQN